MAAVEVGFDSHTVIGTEAERSRGVEVKVGREEVKEGVEEEKGEEIIPIEAEAEAEAEAETEIKDGAILFNFLGVNNTSDRFTPAFVRTSSFTIHLCEP